MYNRSVAIETVPSNIQRVPLEIVFWNFDTFDNNFGIENNLTKYLKESFW